MAVTIKPYSILLIYTKDPKDSTRNFSDLTNTLVKVSGCKINMEKLGSHVLITRRLEKKMRGTSTHDSLKKNPLE